MNRLKKIPKGAKTVMIVLSPLLGVAILHYGFKLVFNQLWPRLFPTPNFLSSLLMVALVLGSILVFFFAPIILAVEHLFDSSSSEEKKG